MARHDVRVDNESDGFVLASMAQRGRKELAEDAAWRAAVAACDILPILLDREDPVNVRVVVGEALSAAEQAESVGRVRGGLRIADGQLALCGGIAYLIDGDAWTEDYARLVAVLPGDYQASVYVYASAPNASGCLERAGAGEPLGAWFRRTRAGEQMPAWLHNALVNDPSEDPGHAKVWKRAKEKRGGQVIDLLVHLEPASGPLAPAPIESEGWALAGEARRPQPFPLGLVASFADPVEAPAPPPPAPPPTAPAEGLSPIVGGLVDVPVAKLARVFRIAWFCHPYTVPRLRVELPQGAKRPPDPEIENVSFAGKGRELEIAIDTQKQSDFAIPALAALGRHLASLPDGSVIELQAARLRKLNGPRPVGAHGYRGTVSAGVWRLDSAFPPISALLLAEALALAEAAEAGRTLVARDAAEAESIEARVMQHAPHAFHSNPLLRSGAEQSVKRRDPGAIAEVAMRAFWLRYGEVWPLQDLDLNAE